MKTVKIIIQSALVALLALCALGWCPSLTSLIFWAAAVLLLPIKPFEDFLAKIKITLVIRIVIAVILAVVAFSVAPDEAPATARKNARENNSSSSSDKKDDKSDEKSDDAAKYQDIDSIRDLSFVVEAGSAGAAELDALNIFFI